MPTSWDARLFARAAAAAGVAFLLTWLLTAATDEGGVSWAERVGRALPVVPACAAIGTWIALAPVCSRGEALALASMGQSPARLALAAVAGSAGMVLAAAIALGACRRIDVAGFFPAATRGGAWVWERGEFLDPVHGLRVAADGSPTSFAHRPAASLAAIPALGRQTAAVSIATTGLALALVVARGLLARRKHAPRGASAQGLVQPSLRTIGVLGATLAATVFLFQAAAARRVPAPIGALPPVALLVLAGLRYRES